MVMPKSELAADKPDKRRTRYVHRVHTGVWGVRSKQEPISGPIHEQVKQSHPMAMCIRVGLMLWTDTDNCDAEKMSCGGCVL